jgi:hypothetical protein
LKFNEEDHATYFDLQLRLWIFWFLIVRDFFYFWRLMSTVLRHSDGSSPILYGRMKIICTRIRFFLLSYLLWCDSAIWCIQFSLIIFIFGGSKDFIWRCAVIQFQLLIKESPPPPFQLQHDPHFYITRRTAQLVFIWKSVIQFSSLD